MHWQKEGEARTGAADSYSPSALRQMSLKTERQDGEAAARYFSGTISGNSTRS